METWYFNKFLTNYAVIPTKSYATCTSTQILDPGLGDRMIMSSYIMLKYTGLMQFLEIKIKLKRQTV